MKYLLILVIITTSISPSISQPNCNWFKHTGDTQRYEACLAAEKAAGHYQFSKEYQQAFDNAIRIDSTWAYPYRAKSVAYLKSGDFIGWKNLIDKAVLYDAKENLEYRAWCRFQFFRDYTGAIDDILLFKKLSTNQIGYSANGNYHLDIALALCYKAIGQSETAINIIIERINDENYPIGIYDYLHLGVLHLEQGKFATAIEYLKEQEKINDIAENRYYIALAYKAINNNDEFMENLSIAKDYYQNSKKMNDPYTSPIDKIFLSTLENATN